MRRPKEVVVLVVLLVGAVAFVLWYVADRKARQQAAPPTAPKVVGPAAPGPAPAVPPPEPVVVKDKQTIDFSSGKGVVKSSAEDQAVIDAAKKEMDAALAEVSFGPAPKTEPPKK
jgi:hypothetical protein